MKTRIACAAFASVLILTGCTSSNEVSTTSEDGRFTAKVSLVGTVQNPESGEVCVAGYEFENHTDESIDTLNMSFSPPLSRYYSVLDFPELDMDTGDGSFLGEKFYFEGWPLESWGYQDAIEARGTLKMAQLVPCSDLGSSFTLNYSRGDVVEGLVTFTTPKQQ